MSDGLEHRAGNPANSHPSPMSATVANWLGVLVGQDKVVELRAFGGAGTIAGFFDGNHLSDMAARAVELSDRGVYKGVYLTLNPVRPDLLNRARNALLTATTLKVVGGLTTNADITHRHCLLVDIDPIRSSNCPATDPEKMLALDRAQTVRSHLEARGWPAPMLCDSGNGYHLLYRVALPADDGGLVQRVLRALARRFDDHVVQIDQSVHNPGRLTRVYGTWSWKGESTKERPHRPTSVLECPPPLLPVKGDCLEALASEGESRESVVLSVPTTTSMVEPARLLGVEEKVARAAAYLARVGPAIAGKNGDRQTYRAARILVKDFALDVTQAWPLLLEYNARCQPPWTEEELRRKLEKAAEAPGECGSKLRLVGEHRSQSLGIAMPVSNSQPCLTMVPDYIQWDSNWAMSQPSVKKNENGRSCRPPLLHPQWILDVVCFALVIQRCNWVVLPDILLAQFVWGAKDNRPANWRQLLGRSLQSAGPDVSPVNPDMCCSEDENDSTGIVLDFNDEWRKGHLPCPRACPLHGRPVPHRHFHLLLNPEAFGALRDFTIEQCSQDLFE
jgi:hypothetical protein